MPAHHSLALALAAACVVAWPLRAGAATVRDARVAIAFLAGACDVTARFAVDTAGPARIDHRLMLGDDGRAPEFAVTGALASPSDIVGRTARLPISLVGSGRNEYEVHYRFAMGGGHADRCPVLVPGAPTDGQSRAVHLAVTFPRDAQLLPGTFPALTWTDGVGRVSLGHLPAFVRVPHAQAGASPGWQDTFDVRRFVDIAAIVVIGAATLAWLALRRPNR